VIENLVLALKVQELPYVLTDDFDDYSVNRLLGLDEAREVCLAVCYVPGTQSMAKETSGEPGELPDSVKGASRVAQSETDYPAIREMHEAGSRAIFSSNDGAPALNHGRESLDGFSGVNPPDTWPESMTCAEAIFYRRSRRNFVARSLSDENVRALLECLSLPDPEAAAGAWDVHRLLSIGFLVGRADGWEPGFYLLNALEGYYGMVRPGAFTDAMARSCLDQAWLSNASLHFVFMSDLEALDRISGARGYRYVMLRAGRLGERLYLAATSMGLGCCGIGAFYDDEAAELLALKEGWRLLYLVAVGPVKSAMPRP
jgi:SagB-type dehydrogenase family enzyme